MQGNGLTASLKIRHPDVDPAVLTRELGLAPQHSWKAGESRDAAEGGDPAGTYRESYWIAQVHPMPYSEAYGTSLGSVLWLTAMVLKRREKFWKRLQAEGATAQVLVSLTSCEGLSLEFPHELLSLLVRLGVSISIDIDPELRVAA